MSINNETNTTNENTTPKNPTTIKYYHYSHYEIHSERIHPAHQEQKTIIQQLTSRKTINPTICNLITTLSMGHIQFLKVINPKYSTQA